MSNVSHHSMPRKTDRVDELDYFAGGVPTGSFFKLRLDELREIVSQASDGHRASITGLAYIGLTAYFESFFKDHFGSIISIVPSLTTNLAARGHETQIDMALVTKSETDLRHRLGFYLAERYDFGTPQKVNAVFGALLGLSPFSKDEATKYDRVLHDRNLLVHHGGTYTTSYLKAAAKRLGAEEPTRAYWDSLRISPKRFGDDADLIDSIGRKVIKSSHAAVTKYIRENGIVLRGARRKALEYSQWWDE
jgi:hypothetical protein